MGQVEVGQKASIEAAGNTYDGTVSKIRKETVLDSQNKAKLQVEIHIENRMIRFIWVQMWMLLLRPEKATAQS